MKRSSSAGANASEGDVVRADACGRLQKLHLCYGM